LQLLFVCCVKTAQFNKSVTCTQRDGNNQIQVVTSFQKLCYAKLHYQNYVLVHTGLLKT